ncbi:hypothetical protein [Floridanema aerugineum]|jgi:hypothetical protein|uniref:Uncharacterized protein n=1 Tax=Floridaenema aerugineum BLCC-F46 TaxID=3153654 RepID=A0ABV4X116_9CYAN
MAKIPHELLTTIFTLLRQLAEQIEAAATTEWELLQQDGETEETIPELEELYSAREKLTARYSRLNTLLLRILEIQPTDPADMLSLLEQGIEPSCP